MLGQEKPHSFISLVYSHCVFHISSVNIFSVLWWENGKQFLLKWSVNSCQDIKVGLLFEHKRKQLDLEYKCLSHPHLKTIVLFIQKLSQNLLDKLLGYE